MSRALDAILCDEIRQESNGKLFAIGIYSHDIQFPEFPATAFLTIWLRFLNFPEGVHPNKLRITANEKNLHELEGELVSNGETVSQAFVQSIPVEFSEPGSLKVEIEFEDGEMLRHVWPVALLQPAN